MDAFVYNVVFERRGTGNRSAGDFSPGSSLVGGLLSQGWAECHGIKSALFCPPEPSP